MTTCSKIFSRIYSGLWKNLYCPETGLFYDRIRDDEDPFGDLPHISEIEKQFPNPGGWGTGMEDCSINAGHMLECAAWHHVLHHAHVENDTGKILQGLRLCESVHGKKGFLVRGVSHRDGKSCYFNSSRDQLTMAVAGMFDLYRLVPSLPEKQRELICLMLEEIASYCRKYVTRENHYSYLRLDGGKALFSSLWECAVHEMLRLPMIYAAAFELCGDPLFRDEALERMEEGLRVSEEFDENKYYWDFPIVQMQLSLDVLRHCSFLEEYHGALGRLMDRVARASIRQFLAVLRECEKYQGDWYIYNTDWRLLPMRLMRDSLKNSSGSAVFDGYAFLNPVYDEAFFRVVELQRSLGNYLTALLLAPETPLAEDEFRRFVSFAGSPDHTRITHAGPFSLLHALLLGESRGFRA